MRVVIQMQKEYVFGKVFSMTVMLTVPKIVLMKAVASDL
jgi:hypothetical protein